MIRKGYISGKKIPPPAYYFLRFLYKTIEISIKGGDVNLLE